MSTNYYWIDRPCNHCHRSDEVHVGKWSSGRSFLFRGWINVPGERLQPAPKPSPFGFDVLSRDDWRRVFVTRSGYLVDEYECEQVDPVEWLECLPRPSPQQIEEETAAIGPYADLSVRDVDGFRFYLYEFS